MYGLIINMCNLVMILQGILDVINFNNPIFLLLVLGGLGECGATFAHASHVPIQDIKRHGTWSSDCVWKYIYSDHSSGENLASTLADTINAL